MKIITYQCEICKKIKETSNDMKPVSLNVEELIGYLLHINHEHVCLPCRSNLVSVINKFISNCGIIEVNKT